MGVVPLSRRTKPRRPSRSTGWSSASNAPKRHFFSDAALRLHPQPLPLPTSRIAILDNFCWGNVNDPAVLGSLVRTAEACRDVAIAFGTPFISGKDSLNNEYRSGDRQHLDPAHAAHLARWAACRTCGSA